MRLKLKSQYNIPKVEEDTYTITNTSNLGIGILMSFYSMIVYSIYTAHKTKNNIGSAVITSGKKNFTLSQAFFDSEKSVSIFFNIMFAGIGIYMCYRKNLFVPKYKEIVIVSSFILIPILCTTLLYVGPSKPIHYILAIIMFLGSIYMFYLIHNIYKIYFYDNEEEILDTYYQFTVVAYIFGSLLTIIFIWYFLKLTLFPKFKLSVKNRVYQWLLTDILAISEYVMLGIIGILLYLFAIFPPIPKL